MSSQSFPYRWRVRARLPERFGQPCRVIVKSKAMKSCLVEFQDGYQVITSRNYIRKRGPDDDTTQATKG